MIQLPIDPFLPEISGSVAKNLNLILTATPGAGKTTRLPAELLKIIPGKIVVMEPRKMAALAASQRVCEERGLILGEEIGYQVRFESRVGPKTRLIYLTDATLLRRMISDPELRGIDLVVIDEFHERNLNQDLVLGAIRELQLLDRKIKLLVMSATLDVDRLSEYLGGAPAVDVPGKVFPLDIRYSPQPLRLQTDETFYERVVDAVCSATVQTTGGILVFLPGTREISRTQERLASILSCEIIALHGSLSLREQRRVLQETEKQRVILATNVAEASLTVPGVDWVIDSGVAKVMEFNAQNSFSNLRLMRISQFNAKQRAGRAARQRAGVCHRLWTQHEDATQAKQPVPECARSDLSSSLVWLAHAGHRDFSSFSWFEKPPEILLNAALRSLRAMGVLKEDGSLAELGQTILHYPLPPRWGSLMALGEFLGFGEAAAQVAAILNERDFINSDSASSSGECDVQFRLESLREFEKGQRSHVFLQAANAVLETSSQLKKMVQTHRVPTRDDLREVLLISQRDRLCRRRNRSERGLMVGGRGVKLAPSSIVRESEFFVALHGIDHPDHADTVVSIACGFDKDFVLRHLDDDIQVVEEIVFDEKRGRFFKSRVRKFADLPLDEPWLVPAEPSEIGERMVQLLSDRWAWLVDQNSDLKNWIERWNFLIHHEPRFKNELSPEKRRKIIAMATFGREDIQDVLRQDFVALLPIVLDPSVLRALNSEVPKQFLAPSGVSHPILYNELHSAFVEIRLQEIFGLKTTPFFVFGKVPLTFRLLGPNFRPVQVTSDLESFWRNGYPEIRKELRARYPKHSWPEDPHTATPAAKGRRR